MRRVIFIAGIVIFIGSLALTIFYIYARENLGINVQNFRKLTSAPRSDIATQLPSINNTNKPIKISAGFNISIFADLKDVGMPRVLAYDQNGVVFVSLTSVGKVVALPDRNNDGVADEKIVVLSGLNKPHGVAFYKDGNDEKVYVAETDKIVVYDYNSQSLELSSGKRILDLPNGGRHFTRTIKIFEDKLYTSIGSSCDVCTESDPERAAVYKSDLNGDNFQAYAKGLRNTAFFTFDEEGRIWGNDMGRDFLGDDLPPDELNVLEENVDYGWPNCYGKSIRDKNFHPWQAIDVCNTTAPSHYNYPAHVAPLGITFIHSPYFDKNDQDNLLVSFHGSWNSSVPVGYKIVKLTIKDGQVISEEDFLSGFVTDKEIVGRPVDLIFDKTGNLYITDDKAGVIYIVNK